MKKGKKEEVPNPGKIGIGKFWAWQSREFSDAAIVLILGYIQFFCTDAIHINPLIVGTILALSKIIDAVTDVAAGYMVDRTNTRFGKGRPYDLCQFGVWICLILLFSCPDSMPDAAKVAWIVVMYTLCKGVFATFLNAGENVFKLRAFTEPQLIRLTSAGGIANSVCGFLVAIILPQAIKNAGTSVPAWTKTMLMFAVPLCLLGMCRFLFVKEKYHCETQHQAEEKVSLKSMFHMLGENKHIWPFFFTSVIINVFASMGVGTYFFTHVIGNLGMMSVFAALAILALPALFILPALMRRFSKRNIMVVCSAISILCGVIGFLFYNNMVVIGIVYVVSQAASLPGTYMGALIIMDCADFNEWKGRHRMEGTLSSVIGFAKNAGSALGTFLLGVALTLIKYDAEAASVSDFTRKGLIILMFLLPAIGAGIQLLCMWQYKLEDLKPRINADNESRHASAMVSAEE